MDATPNRFRSVLSDRALFLMRRLIGDMQVHCIVSLDGTLDRQRLERAVRLSVDAIPLFGCRYVVDMRQPYFERRTDLDQLELVTDGKDATDLERFMAQGGNPCHDPLAQVLVLGGARDTLCVKVSHLVADGHGAKEYIYRLAEVYRRLEWDPSYIPPRNLDAQRSLRQVSRCLGPLDKLKVVRRFLRDRRSRFAPGGYWSFPAAPGRAVRNPARGKYYFERFGAREFRQIRDLARRFDATLNDLFLAAYCRSLHSVICPDPGVPLRLQSTVDLRRYLPTEHQHSVCNLSGFHYPNFGTNPGRTLEEFVSIVHEEMSLQKTDMLGLGDFAVLPLFCGSLPFPWTERRVRDGAAISTALAPPGFTNAGSFDPDRLSFGDARAQDAAITASLFHAPNFMPALSSFEDSITLSAGYYEDGVREHCVRRLFRTMRESLLGPPEVDRGRDRPRPAARRPRAEPPPA